MAGMITPQFGELQDVASFGNICVPEIHPAQLVLYIHLLLVYWSYRFGPSNPISAPV